MKHYFGLTTRARRESGQSLVETALLMPLLIGIVLGVADFGYLAYCFIELGNASNAGVHYAAQNVTTAADTTGIKNAVTNSTNMSNITVNNSIACSCSDGTTSITCTNFSACVDPHRIISVVTVTTQKSINPLIPWSDAGITLPGAITMHGTATMRVEE